VFGDILTDSHSAEAVLGAVRWFLRFFNDSKRDIKRDFITTVPNEHYNREEAHRAQVFREIRTVTSLYLQDLGHKHTNVQKNSRIYWIHSLS